MAPIPSNRCALCTGRLKDSYGTYDCKCNCDHQKLLGHANVCRGCCGHNECRSCGKCFTRTPDPRLAEEFDLCRCNRCTSCYASEGVTPACGCCDALYGVINIGRRAVTRFCVECCSHRCCSINVEQVTRPIVFWTPTAALAKTEFPYASLTSSDAERVLAGNFPGLNLRLFQRHKSRRYTSVEIEVSKASKNGKAINVACDRWSCSVVHDGSINNHGPGGFEINTAPACGDALEAQLRDITDALATASATANATCGLHVHVDTRDFGYHDIQRLVQLYIPIEPALFAATTPERADSRFCRPCAKFYSELVVDGVKSPVTKSLKEAIIDTTYGRGASTVKRGLNGRVDPPPFYGYREAHRGAGDGTARYWALNIHTWFRQGTVESRLHHGTVDFNEILGWAKLHTNLVDTAYRFNPSEVTEALAYRDDVIKAELCQIIGCKPPKSETSSLGKVMSGLVILSRLVPDEDVIYLAQKIELQRRNKRSEDG